MVPVNSDVRLIKLLAHSGHRRGRRKNAIGPDQSLDLHPQRNEGSEIDESQAAKKKPAHEQVVGSFHVIAPGKTSQPGENLSVLGHESVESFRDASESRRVRVPIIKPISVGVLSESAEGGFRPANDGSVRQQQVNGSLELLAPKLRETRCDGGVLQRKVIDT